MLIPRNRKDIEISAIQVLSASTSVGVLAGVSQNVGK